MVKPIDCTDMDALSVANYIEERLNIAGNGTLGRKNYYCGITDNPDRRLEEHEIEKFDCCVKCSSYAVSSEAEKILSSRGFDCGKKQGMGNKDSVYVYAYLNLILG